MDEEQSTQLGSQPTFETSTPIILIVDDDPALLQALPHTVSLRLPHIAVETVDSAQLALALLQEREFDAVVSDIKMPGMDGLALLAQMKDLQPETPMLLITGHGDHDLAIQALRGGAYDYIQKPIDRDVFVAAVRRAIQSHQLRLQVREQQRALEQHAHSLERLIHERTRELIEANAAKDEFLSMAAHELKTPLTSLKGMTQLLRRRLERVGSSEAGNVATMENAIRRLEGLMNDVLSTSFLQSGTLTLHRQPCDLVKLCACVIEEYRMGIAPTHSLLFEAPNEAVELEVDIDRISQVLINLLSNAIKYSPKGAPVSILLRKGEQQCWLSVRDEGVGIPEEYLSSIFDRFYRVPGLTAQTGSSEGLGLGLYISQHIVQRHGGVIEVQSVPGRGSTFTVMLPLSVEPPASEHETAIQLLPNRHVM